ncbi:hypothetical protein DJ84_13100, partial [Halorubrum ezzemoulense]
GMGRIGAVALALVILVSMLAMPLGAGLATAQSGPSGMVALGPDQVDEDLPSDADVPIRASDLEGNVYASDHAGSLQITVTTPERASDYMGENANVVADDEIAIVLADDEVHEGRDVAVDLDVLEAGVGYVPDVAYGVHDSGEEWQSPIEQTDGVGRFHIDEFSSNSVTFSGGIELSGNSAADGTNYEYELDNLNGVEDYAINLTGVTNTEWSNTSDIVTNGESLSISSGGNVDPVGPASNNNPQITISAPETTQTPYNSKSAPEVIWGYDNENGNNIAINSEMLVPGADHPINEANVYISGGNGGTSTATVDVYLAEDGIDETYTDGERVAQGVSVPLESSGWVTIPFDKVYNPSSSDVTLQFVTTGGPTGDYAKVNT